MAEEPIKENPDGRRYFRATLEVYQAFSAAVDQAQGYPKGTGTRAETLRGLPEAGSLTVKDGQVEISVEAWRISESLNGMLAQQIEAGNITEYYI